MIANEVSESQTGYGKVPANIKVFNLALPETVTNQMSLLKQVRAKLALLEPLLRPLVDLLNADEDS